MPRSQVHKAVRKLHHSRSSRICARRAGQCRLRVEHPWIGVFPLTGGTSVRLPEAATRFCNSISAMRNTCPHCLALNRGPTNSDNVMCRPPVSSPGLKEKSNNSLVQVGSIRQSPVGARNTGLSQGCACRALHWSFRAVLLNMTRPHIICLAASPSSHASSAAQCVSCAFSSRQ
jgi:hypothetical protein